MVVEERFLVRDTEFDRSVVSMVVQAVLEVPEAAVEVQLLG